jgi:hypothetical protein
MKTTLKSLALALVAALLLIAGFAPESPIGLSLWTNASAIVGIPISPVSVAGVARRTTRRVVVAEGAAASTAAASQQHATAQQQSATAAQQSATAAQQSATAQQQAVVAKQQAGAAPAVGTIVTALPAGCAGVAKAGVEYQQCGAVYYRAAFQGNNLVYVVQQP